MTEDPCSLDFMSTRDFLRKLSKHATELAALRTAAAAG
jgi:hypothetical protein